MLTCVELTGLLIVIGVGVWALGIGEGDFSRVTEFDTGDKSVLAGVIAATGLAFFAMVGFEDSVNMAEECKEPRRIFPKVLLLGLGITGVIYVLVSISAIALVPADAAQRGRHPAAAGGRGRRARLPARPVRRHHDVRRRQHRADQHADGQPAGLRPRPGAACSRRCSARCTPAAARPTTAILFTTALAFGLITFVGAVPALGGTTALLLLMVFTVVNVAVLVLRKDPVDADHFRTPDGAAGHRRARLRLPGHARSPAGPPSSTRSPASCSRSASSCGA